MPRVSFRLSERDAVESGGGCVPDGVLTRRRETGAARGRCALGAVGGQRGS